MPSSKIASSFKHLKSVVSNSSNFWALLPPAAINLATDPLYFDCSTSAASGKIRNVKSKWTNENGNGSTFETSHSFLDHWTGDSILSLQVLIQLLFSDLTKVAGLGERNPLLQRPVDGCT